jgi:dipeptidyl-peptidase 4
MVTVKKTFMRIRTGAFHVSLLTGTLAIAASLAALPTAAQTAMAGNKQLTVERIFAGGQPSLSGAFAGGMEFSPDGSQLTSFHSTGDGPNLKTELWTMDTNTGEHHVLVAADVLSSLTEPPKGKPSQATGLGRRPPSAYHWAPNGKALLFAGSDELVWLDLATMKSRVLVQGEKEIEDPKISPDSSMVSYVQDYNLWIVGLDGGAPRQITKGGSEEVHMGSLDWVYPEELDISTAYWWSPDSLQIAFLQMDERPVTPYPIVNFLSYHGDIETERYPKTGDANPIVRVGVVPAAGGSIQWMDTGKDTDVYLARVNWLTDSKRVAIQRINRAQTRLDLLVADASTGRASSILSEQDRYWVNVTDDLHFLSDGRRFIWSSERSGYRHLYLYDTNGKRLIQLTRGDWQVNAVEGIDEKGGFVYFTSTEKSPIENHLYRVALAGGKTDRLTQESGTHSIQISPVATAWVDIFSTAMTPPRTDLYRADGTRVAVINENKVPELTEYGLSPVQFLTVDASDGTKLSAMMIKPTNFDSSKKYPVLVYVYGGPHAQQVRDAWSGATFLWLEMMAEKGYIIFTLDNRGAAGRGHVFETPIYHHFGKVELEDQLAGVSYLKSQPWVDGSRIGIWGWSYGGFMTVNAMLNANDVFKTGFAGGPVTDWRQYDTIYTERYMGRPQENPEGYKDSSPVNHAANLRGKLLIAHGTGDDNVHFANTVELIEQFIQNDKYAEVAIYPGRGHGVSDPPARLQLFQRVTQFFLDNL